MPEVSIPKDQDQIAALAIKILTENRVLSKAFGTTIPKKTLKRLRPARPAARILKRIRRMRDEANKLASNLDLTDVTAAERDIAQILLRQVDLETVKYWGYAFKVGSRKASKKE